MAVLSWSAFNSLLSITIIGACGFFFCQNLNTYSFRGDYDFTVKKMGLKHHGVKLHTYP